MAKTAIFLAEGMEEIEGLTVVDLLRRAGISIEMVSLNGDKMVMGSHGIRMEADTIFEAADFDSYDMLILPGGMPGTTHLLEHIGLRKQLLKFHAAGKMLAAICAAPMVLGENGILEGKKAVCYPGIEKHLKGAAVCSCEVVTDGNIITSRGLGTAIAFASAIIAHFMGSGKAKEIEESILYRA